ncbi:MAG: succinyl-diaminopimelate desuccinylase [Propionibacteriaceae bacterium]|nr:succinyl-diaminopimelate desuccinylase [Propionibacteriaceae bacterium]
MTNLPLDLRADLAELFATVVDTESVSGHETQLADAVEAALSAYPHLAITRLGNALAARTELGRDQRVIIAGHLDTVPPAANLPSQWRQVDGQTTLWGRGSVDMKGGLTVQLALAAALTEPAYDLTWFFYDNEEVSADRSGLLRFVQQRPDLLAADLAILMEPTAGRIEAGCQGTLRAELTTRGEAVHAARSWLGHNAIHDLARALVILQTFAAPSIEVDGLTYREGLNAVAISGGIASNVIPDQASLQINYRFAPDKTLTEAEAVVRALFQGYDLTLVDAAPAARPGLNQPLVQSLVAAVGGQVGPKYGWTDVARFAELGLPAVNFGPGDPNLAHRDDEACALAEVVAVHDRLKAWLT